ncbi:hypothetical protein QR77_23555 [Streptomyces sp. 150FB]|uniref:hypothetical protein n=1 Tax=Streptomyces sp. 150FB TaxID=1576605 RepID=UPI0005890517|nr:hypothetical protein [Streptomyces sp. 150FB]KIF76061.1 hypothetical protein QR77_23555 [Streptomyces sp. 150FB]
MAYDNFSAALRTPAHPLAKPGYGKRNAPDQHPRGEADFAHLRTREAAVAAYIDRLPEGTAIGYKALAAHIADYGQQACGKALNFLSDAGHLRRIKEHLQLDDNTFRWVTHTFFSRTPREDDWWRRLVDGMRGIDLTEQEREARQAREAIETALGAGAPGAPDAPPVPDSPAPVPVPVPAPAPEPEPEPEPERASAPVTSTAYRALQRLGRAEPRMTLSAAECAALEPLAAQWLARGASQEHLTRSLTEGLPHPLHSPGAIARTRLEKKMPPEPIQERAHVNYAVMVCASCEVPDNVSPLTRGICDDCREDMSAYEAAEEAEVTPGHVPDTFRRVPAQVDTARRADEARAAGGLRSRASGR